MNPTQTGFNRIELLIMVASLGLLAAVLASTVILPMYRASQLKPKFAAVVNATEPYKTTIEICARYGPCATSGALSGLQEGTLGIPDTTSGTYLASVRVASNGTITATATRVEGLAGETYVLTPTFTRNAPITWTVSGTCKTRPGWAIC
jgi:Tfp pilus assembly major pilin PilA